MRGNARMQRIGEIHAGFRMFESFGQQGRILDPNLWKPGKIAQDPDDLIGPVSVCPAKHPFGPVALR